MNEEITYEELHKLFIYSPESGLLFTKDTLGLVGTLSNGYLRVTINNKSYAVHRIIYCMYYGHFPLCQVDHINRIKTDNKIKNLRDVSQSCNSRNVGNNKINKSGIKGVTWIKGDQSWRATIGVDNKAICIAHFKFFINAVKARAYAEELFNYHLYDEESPAVKYLNSVKYLSTNEKKKFNKKSAYSEWEFFMSVRKEKIDKLAEIYQKF